MDAIGVHQLCVGQDSGNEVAVHTINQTFHSVDREAIPLVDAFNAFNSLNRQVALRNMLHLCPSLAKIIMNTYKMM